ncbi:zinc finger protein 708-like [Lucilia sericata]|uniref:zinc finger protein 708-like n=1 Tax=Lucilia sericata TaxID=13632 RepID=UPI0018A84E8C|nr:zinc finger protein 708-like [Lucilia sericata]XP_037816731.1 zinc finger protein 708-like [Lucilia sericata]
MDLKVCRICGGVEQLKNILDQGTEMMDKFLVCTNINIYCGDLLPKLICEQCDIKLDLSYRLRKQSEDTQKRLRWEINKKVGVLQENDMKNSFDASSSESETDISNCRKIDQSVHCNKSFEKNIGENCTTLHEIKDINEPIENEEQASNLKKETEIIGENCIIIDNDIIEYKSCNIDNDHILDDQLHNEETDILVFNVDEDEVINTSDDIYNLEEPIKNPVTSEYCIIDLLSSSSESTASDHCIDLEFDNSENSLTCNTCHEVFTKKKDYSIHIKQHGEERYQCIQCCKFFPTRFRLKRHEETHNDIATYNCPHCKRSYRALYNLNRHIRSAHLEEKGLNCNICSVSFSRADVLKRHMQLHSEEKNYSCLLCSRSFKTRDYLYAHDKAHHSGNSYVLKKNKRTKAESANQNQCGQCGKLFKSSFAYKNHLLIHTNEKPYECETCNKKFRTIAALTTHQRIHDDYRPYQCDLCLKSFKQTAHLKEHKLLHSDSAPQHVCTICQAPFNKKSNLKAHMRIHSKEKPFKCADCSAEFTYMSLLQRHASKVHNRSAHKVYIINESDETIEAHDIIKSNSMLESELYIDTVTDDDFDPNVANIVHLIEDDHEMYRSSSELEIINDEPAIAEKTDVETCALESQTIFDSVQILSIDSIQSQSHETEFVNGAEDCENHIIEQKVDLFVSEETKLTSSVCNVNRLK